MYHSHILILHGIWEWNLVKIELTFWPFLQRFVQIKLKSHGILGTNMVDLIRVAFQLVLMISNLIKMLHGHATQILVKTAENALTMGTTTNASAKSVFMAQNVKMVSQNFLIIFLGKLKFLFFCWNFQIFDCTSGWILVILVDLEYNGSWLNPRCILFPLPNSFTNFRTKFRWN